MSGSRRIPPGRFQRDYLFRMLSDFASSGLWNGLECYIRSSGKNVGEGKSKTVITLPESALK